LGKKVLLGGGGGVSTFLHAFLLSLSPSRAADAAPVAAQKRWKADGHLSAVMKDSGAVRARQVLERKAQEHKVSFLA
jgi:hypothetical protein